MIVMCRGGNDLEVDDCIMPILSNILYMQSNLFFTTADLSL